MWECDLFDGGVCKPFPPPLVRGGVFEVGLETKYRDIADGNFRFHVAINGGFTLVGNQVPRYSGWKQAGPLFVGASLARSWKPSTAI